MAERDLKSCPDCEVETGEGTPESEKRRDGCVAGLVPFDMDGALVVVDRIMERIPNTLKMLEDS